MLLEKGPLDQGRHRSFLNELIPELDSMGRGASWAEARRNAFQAGTRSGRRHNARWERLCSVRGAGWGEVQGLHQGTGWLAMYDKLALRRAASFVYKNTDSKQCSSALNLRPGKSLTHAHGGENKLEDPRLGSRGKVV